MLKTKSVFCNLSIRLKPPTDCLVKEKSSTKYLSVTPVTISLNDGLVIWLEYQISDSKERLVFKLDKRAKIHAVDIESLPKAPTRKTVPEICRSTTDQIMEESYKSVFNAFTM